MFFMCMLDKASEPFIKQKKVVTNLLAWWAGLRPLASWKYEDELFTSSPLENKQIKLYVFVFNVLPTAKIIWSHIW